MRNINELIGIIKGISFDGVINEKEVACLQDWVDKNRNLAYDDEQIEMIRLVDDALEDGIITDEERRVLLEYSMRFEEGDARETSSIYELNGIIEGIISDDELNDDEVYKLQIFLDENKNVVEHHGPSKQIYDLVEDILEDGIVTEDEQRRLLALLRERIDDTQLQTKINHLKLMVRERKNIGLELIDLLDNEKAISYIHELAVKQFSQSLSSYSGLSVGNQEIIFISLCFIAMLDYDGNYYESVRNTYHKLYQWYSDQKIEGTIRTIIDKYKPEDVKLGNRERKINIVLYNAIVPKHFLGAFFEFVYDIYKLNFDSDLPDDLQEEFEFVYDGLKSSLTSDDDEVKLGVTKKSYKLIKSTKDLIRSSSGRQYIIALSVIAVKLIDKRVWGKEIKIFNPYLKTGFETWEQTLENNEKTRERKRIRSRWEPEFYASSNTIYLSIPNHRIKSTYDYSSIHAVVKNGESVIYSTWEPDIREIIGGYQISIEDVKVESPLGEISYQLYSGNDIIYDSKDRLFRSYIVFDTYGNELKNNRDYDGTIAICSKHGIFRDGLYYASDKYDLVSKIVRQGDTIMINDDVFSFSALVKPGVFGNQIEGLYLQEVDSQEMLDVYSDIKYLMFETKDGNSQKEIVINGRPKLLSDYAYKESKRGAYHRYLIDLALNKSALYRIEVYETRIGKRERVFVIEFGLDIGITHKETRIDDARYEINIVSDLLEDIISKEIDVHDFDEDAIRLILKGRDYIYHIPLKIDAYRIKGASGWRPLSEDLWIGEIDQTSVLEIFGRDVDEIMVNADALPQFRESLKVRELSVKTETEIGCLMSFKDSRDYSLLGMLSEGRLKWGLRCYNKCVLNEKATEIQFDPTTKMLLITPVFYGSGDVVVRIFDESDNLIEEQPVKNKHVLVINGLVSFVKYRIVFAEKARGLSLQKYREMYTFTKIFYSMSDLVGRYYRIKSVQFDQLVRGEFLRKEHFFNTVYVYITEMIDEENFVGEIMAKTFSGIYTMNNINPVDVQVCGSVIDDELELSITKDGDGLYLDFERHSVKNSLYDEDSVDIISYIIDINGVGRI